MFEAMCPFVCGSETNFLISLSMCFVRKLIVLIAYEKSEFFLNICNINLSSRRFEQAHINWSNINIYWCTMDSNACPLDRMSNHQLGRRLCWMTQVFFNQVWRPPTEDMSASNRPPSIHILNSKPCILNLNY